MSAYEREARRAARLQEFEEVRALNEQFQALGELHLDHFEPASPPVAPPPEPVDRAAAAKAAERAARAGIRWWKRSERKAASAEAAVEASREADVEEARRETRRQEDQRKLDEAWQKLLASEPETTRATIAGAFADNAYPAELVGLVDSHASIVMTVAPAEELVPERRPELTPTGRPTTKRITKTDRNSLYLYVLASGLIATAREAFAVAPALEVATVIVNRRGAYFTPVLVAQFSRGSLDGLDEMAGEGPLAILGRSEGGVVNLKGRTDELAPLDLSDDAELAEQLTAVAEGLGLELDPGTSLPKESRDARKPAER